MSCQQLSFQPTLENFNLILMLIYAYNVDVPTALDINPLQLIESRVKLDGSLPLVTEKHEEFSWRYALCGNATDAYEQVYGCSRDSASRAGSFLLSHVEVRARVDFIQRAQTDAAFATITRNLNAKKVIVHDSDAVLTEVDDPMAQIAAATTILKANGRIQSGQFSTTNTTNYSIMALTNVDGLGKVADKIIDMNERLLGRMSKAATRIMQVPVDAQA